MAIGLNLMILSNQGVDPLSTFLAGLTNIIPMQLGTMISIFNGLLLIAIFFYDSQYIGLGSFINGIFLGIFSNLLLPSMNGLTNFPSLILTVLAVLAFPLGIAIYMNMDLGLGSTEALMYVVANKFSGNIGLIRTSLDIFFIVVGILLGAEFGYGTFIIALVNGSLIQKYSNLLKRN